MPEEHANFGALTTRLDRRRLRQWRGQGLGCKGPPLSEKLVAYSARLLPFRLPYRPGGLARDGSHTITYLLSHLLVFHVQISVSGDLLLDDSSAVHSAKVGLEIAGKAIGGPTVTRDSPGKRDVAPLEFLINTRTPRQNRSPGNHVAGTASLRPGIVAELRLLPRSGKCGESHTSESPSAKHALLPCTNHWRSANAPE